MKESLDKKDFKDFIEKLQIAKNELKDIPRNHSWVLKEKEYPEMLYKVV